MQQIGISAVGQRVVGRAFDPVVRPAWVAAVHTAPVPSFEDAAKAAGIKVAVRKSCLEFAKAKLPDPYLAQDDMATVYLYTTDYLFSPLNEALREAGQEVWELSMQLF